jgi:hypothetical protein
VWSSIFEPKTRVSLAAIAHIRAGYHGLGALPVANALGWAIAQEVVKWHWQSRSERADIEG